MWNALHTDRDEMTMGLPPVAEARSAEETRSEPLFDRIHSLYVENRVASAIPDDKCRHFLHERCPDREQCWGSRIAEAHAATWNEICLPHVGAKYGTDARRVVVLGLNYVQTGGMEQNQRLVREAAAALKAGNRKVDFGNPTYGGTLYWHRAAAYAGQLVWHDWEIVGDIVRRNSINALDDRERLGSVFDSIAYLEAVKCSPPWQMSVPTREMTQRCPERFLQHELRVLAPTAILRLGRLTPTGLGATSTRIRDVEDSPLRCSQVTAAWGPTLVITVPHPTSYGGNRRSFVAQLARLLRDFGV